MSYDEWVDSYLADIFVADPIYGRHLLGDILEMDYKNGWKWYWVTDFLKCDSPTTKRECIEQEFQKNPHNNIARRALALYPAEGKQG